MADEIDIANDRMEQELARAINARIASHEVGSLHCIDCGTDNTARAAIGRSRCIDCQGEYERQYSAYKVR